MTIPDLHQLYGFLRDSARFTKVNSGKKVDGVQTFAVIRAKSDLNTENLMRSIYSRHKPFIWSKKMDMLKASKIVWEYPLLAVQEISYWEENAFSKKGSTQCDKLQLYFLYPNVEICEKASIKQMCERLEPEEIRAKMEKLKGKTFAYLSSLRCAEIIKNQGQQNEERETVWYPKELLDLLKNRGDCDNYTIDTKSTNHFKLMLRNRNSPSIKGGIIDDWGADKLCGIAYEIIFCRDCIREEGLEFDLSCC